MKKLFAYDSKLSYFLRVCFKLFFLNFFWLLCCIPVVTIGAATAAMYKTALDNVLEENGYLLKSYFRSFAQNFKQATIINLIYLVIGTLFSWECYYCYQLLLSGEALGQLWIVFALLLALLIVLGFYSFCYVAKFECSVAHALRDSVLLMLSHILQSLLFTLCIVGTIIAISYMNFLIAFLPIIPALFIVKRLDKTFEPHVTTTVYSPMESE